MVGNSGDNQLAGLGGNDTLKGGEGTAADDQINGIGDWGSLLQDLGNSNLQTAQVEWREIAFKKLAIGDASRAAGNGFWEGGGTMSFFLLILFLLWMALMVGMKLPKWLN